MKKIFRLWILFTIALHAQQNSAIRILHFTVDASVDEQNFEISGNASLWIQILQPADNIQFSVPPPIEIESVRDIDDDKFSQHRVLNERNWYTHTIEFPSQRSIGDSVFIKIEFTERLDTSSFASQFICSQEFLLQYSKEMTWLPFFSVNDAENVSLKFSLPQSMSVLCGVPHDSISYDDPHFRWYFSRRERTSLRNIFTLCGSQSVTELKRQSTDSLSVITFLVDTTRFNQHFADSLMTYLAAAATTFKQITGSASEKFNITFACIGGDHVRNNDILTAGVIIKRNSPAHTIFDSTIFTRSTKNVWLIDIARTFALSTADSMELFNKGFAGYLATRFIISQYPEQSIELRERFDVIANALNFYPAASLQYTSSADNQKLEDALYKGRYVFLMLEYLLNKEPFSTVLETIHEQYPANAFSIKDFQTVCEEEYGSSLDWFFQEWLNNTSIPEFAMQWSAERTQRGAAVVKVTIDQRSDVFMMPLTLVCTVGGKKIPKRILVEQAKQEFSFTLPSLPATVELDPQLNVLRWLLDVRILAHARTSMLFRVYDRNISLSEREALLTLELDPVNATGSTPLAFFSLGKLSILQNNIERAKEYFVKAMQSKSNEETQQYPILALIRYGNILEMEGKRSEALPLYQRALIEGKRNPSVYAVVIIEAERYLREPFISSEDFWYGVY